ncbi:MAG TPA: ABC transporter permease [Ferrovibrio sp.]|jgi:peptide/nickel transport system permease protein|uniref:ABC transporter permease n=1 Tax=Ferrovibrio sp. TaxID=1917215 RepID=UPI002B4B6C6A|nr:ABC transporter permease [Ferrovibrio sp.]HLT78996.1 ABC transporter permease [Ferrovibrio sp.]
MLVFIIRRLMQAALVVAVMSVLVFAGIYMIGDPLAILASPEATELDREQIARALGLDRPVWEQYLRFVGSAFGGDFGKSFVFGQPAMKLVLERMPATLELAITATVMAVLIGVPLGLYAGLRHETTAARTIMAGSVLGFSLPNFWVGLMLIMIFAVQLGWLPASGRGQTVEVLGLHLSIFTANGWKHIILPAITLGLSKCALIIRLARATAREVMLMDFVKFARAKGLNEKRIIGVHILKNIMVPITTVTGLELGALIAFAVITETIFSWPGMGKLLIDSIVQLDRPVVVAYLIIVVLLLVIINLVVDILYSVLDPRVRLGNAK